MKNLLSGTEIRWWFRSRQSGHLNSLSYWLCVLMLSALLTLIVSALWRVHSAKQSRRERNYIAEQSRLQRAAEDSDWLDGAPLKTLEPYRNRFLEKRKELINRIRYGDQEPHVGDLPLRPTNNIKNKGSLPNKASNMLGNPDVRVYPEFATFSSKGRRENLTEAEKVVFNNFAKFVTSLYNGQKNKDASHVERTLAEALGLSEPNAGAAPLNVPWIYVASKDGAIALFPGSTVIHEPSWETTSRPWFRASLGGDSQLFKKGLLEEDLLTVTYLDVLAKQPMLVRTYMYKFDFAVENATAKVKNPTQEFVICIDIFRGSMPSGVTASSAGAVTDKDVTFVEALTLPRPFGYVHYAIFALSLLLFTGLRWIATDQNSKLTFTRTSGLYGKINVEDGLRMQTDELMMKENKIGLDIGKYALGKIEKSKQEKNNIMIHTSVEKPRPDLRGCELWTVSQNTSTTWSILWIEFEYTKTAHVGTIELVYTSEVLPEANWISFNRLAFSECEVMELQANLLRTLERNVDLCEGSLNIPNQIPDVPSFPCGPSAPEWLPALVNAKELLAVRQRRAYVRLTSEQFDRLYSKANVKAVMTSGYLEQLLNHGDVDFLSKGKTISRIISFPNEATTLNLTATGHDAFEELMGRYLPVNARRLQRVDVPINNQSEQSPVYDFALLDKSCVIVAHSISKTAGIDGASGQQTKPTYVIEGYISWRLADIEFYHGLFDQLERQANPLTLPANGNGIIDERLGSLSLN